MLTAPRLKKETKRGFEFIFFKTKGFIYFLMEFRTLRYLFFSGGGKFEGFSVFLFKFCCFFPIP